MYCTMVVGVSVKQFAYLIVQYFYSQVSTRYQFSDGANVTADTG